MTNLPKPATGTNECSASSLPQREAQRTRTGVRIMAILGQFWRDDATPDAVQAIELEGWMDVLEPLTEREIRDAWAVYQRTGPRSRNGALRKPDARSTSSP